LSTKASIAEQIKRIIGKSTADARLDEREIMINVEQTLAYLIRTRYFLSKRDDVPEIHGGLISSFKDVSVKYDEDEEKYFFVVPSKTVDIPHGYGIKSVSPSTEPQENYIEVNNGFGSLYSGSGALKISGKIGFYRQGQRIYFQNMKKTEKPDTIIFRAVLGIGSLGKHDRLDIPADMEKECVDYVVQLYSNYQPSDDAADNVDKG